MTGRLIRKTPGRFLSLLAIVLLGTAFYIGVSAISKAMSTSVNRYDDLLNLKDITIYSNYGFDQADVDAVEQLDSIVLAEGSSFVDVYSVYEDSSAITRIHSWSPDAQINQFVLRSGRLPERKDEVLADNGTILLPGYKPGTVLTLTRPENDLGDTLSVDTVTVVGTIDTPLYLNETREASTLSNLYIQTFLYIPEEAFITDYYTEMNVLIKDGKTYDEFSDEYRAYSASVKEEIKAYSVLQKDKRPARLKSDAMEEYRKGRREYEDGLAEYYRQIGDAEEKIRKAELELAGGWKEVRDGQTTLSKAQAELERAREDAEAEINAGKEKLADGYRRLAEGKAELEEKEEEYTALRTMLSEALKRLNQPLISESMTLLEALDYLSGEQRTKAIEIIDTLGIDTSAVTVGDVLSWLREYVNPTSIAAMDQLIEEAMMERETVRKIIEDQEVPFVPEASETAESDTDPLPDSAGNDKAGSTEELTPEDSAPVIAAEDPASDETLPEESVRQLPPEDTEPSVSAEEPDNSGKNFREDEIAAEDPAEDVSKEDPVPEITEPEENESPLPEPSAPSEAPSGEEENREDSRFEEILPDDSGMISAGEDTVIEAVPEAETINETPPAVPEEQPVSEEVLQEEEPADLQDIKEVLPSEEPLSEVSESEETENSVPEAGTEPVLQCAVIDEEIRPVLLGTGDDTGEHVPSAERIVTERREAPKTIGELASILQEENASFSFLIPLIADPDMELEQAVKLLHEYADRILDAETMLDRAMHEPLPDELTLGELSAFSDEVSQLKEQLDLADETTLGEVRALLRKNIADIDNGLAEGRKAIADAEAELQRGEEELARGLAELEQGLREGQEEINAGWKKISESIALLADGRRQLNSSLQTFETEKAEGKQKLDDAEAELEQGLADIEAMPEAEWTVLDRSQHYSSETYRGTINQMAAIARIFPAFFIAVAALVCLTTMTRLVNEERGQIGILRALGYRPGQCSFVYLSYAALAGIFGCALGTAVGLATFPIIIYNTWRMLYILPKMQMEIPWGLILAASAVFVLMMMAVTEYVLHDDMKEVPSVIMRPKAPRVGKDILLENVGVIWNRISFSWKVTIRNLARYKRRMAMTVLGVGGCTALLVTGFGIADSINNIVNIQFNEISLFDARVHLDLTQELPPDPERVKAKLLAMDTTDSVVPAAEYSGIVSPDGETEEVATVEVFRDAATLAEVYNLRERVGHEPISVQEGSVIISEKMAENLSLSAGDEIFLESRDGERKPVTVSGITEMYVYHYVMMTESTYRKLYQAKPEINTLFLRLKEGAEAGEELKAATAAIEGVDSVDFVDFVIRNFETMIQGIDGVVLVLVAASMGLAFVVLGNLTNVNISERMREIATLKVLGFRRREVQNYIYHENNIMVAMGALIGLPAGRQLSGYIMREVELTNVMFGRGVEPMTYVYAFALTMLFGTAVNLVMRRKLNAVKMVESLKSVE